MNTRRWFYPERRKPLTRKEYVALFMEQDGRCTQCGQKLETKGGVEVELEPDDPAYAAPARDEHLDPLWRGGGNEMANRELWCHPCTKPKDAEEATQRAKCLRVRDKYIGAPMKRQSPQSKFKKKLDGTVVWRETGEPVR
jgi:hypothetical protein